MGSVFDYIRAPDALRLNHPRATPGRDMAVSNQVDRRMYQLHVCLLAIAVYYGERDWSVATLVTSHLPCALVTVRPSLLGLCQLLLFIYLTYNTAVYGTGYTTCCMVTAQLFVTYMALLVKRVWYGLDAHHC